MGFAMATTDGCECASASDLYNGPMSKYIWRIAVHIYPGRFWRPSLKLLCIMHMLRVVVQGFGISRLPRRSDPAACLGPLGPGRWDPLRTICDASWGSKPLLSLRYTKMTSPPKLVSSPSLPSSLPSFPHFPPPPSPAPPLLTASRLCLVYLPPFAHLLLFSPISFHAVFTSL